MHGGKIFAAHCLAFLPFHAVGVKRRFQKLTGHLQIIQHTLVKSRLCANRIAMHRMKQVAPKLMPAGFWEKTEWEERI